MALMLRVFFCPEQIRTRGGTKGKLSLKLQTIRMRFMLVEYHVLHCLQEQTRPTGGEIGQIQTRAEAIVTDDHLCHIMFTLLLKHARLEAAVQGDPIFNVWATLDP